MALTPEQAAEIARIEDIDQLRALRAKLITQRSSGVGKVSIRSAISNREVEYRSDAEMAAAIADLDRKINALAGGSPVQIVNIRSSRGW